VGRISKARPQSAAPAAVFETQTYCCYDRGDEVARLRLCLHLRLTTPAGKRLVQTLRRPLRMRSIAAQIALPQLAGDFLAALAVCRQVSSST
jgi:hypothetical protein